MPTVGEIKTKTCYITDYPTLMSFRDKFKNAPSDTKVFFQIIKAMVGYIPYVSDLVNILELSCDLGPAAIQNYSNYAYYTLVDACDKFALGQANSCVVFLDFKWVYNGYNKQYWQLTNKLTTIMGND